MLRLDDSFRHIIILKSRKTFMLTAAPSGKPVCAIGGGSENLNPRSLKIFPSVNASMSA